jgi:hypothetical protein
MKRNYFFIALFCLISFTIFSQGSTCPGAQPFCAGGSGLTFTNTTGVLSPGSNSCLGSTPNPAWFFLQIGIGGNLNFTISQTSNTGNPIDVDFIAWGPFAAATCAAADLSPANEVGCSYSTAAVENFTIAGAVPGQIYMVLITNFNGQAGQISLTQTNAGQAGAGSTDCNIVCPLAVNGGGVICAGSQATLTATIAGATTYQWSSSVTGPIAGNTQSINVSQPGTYTVVVNKPGCVANATASTTITFATAPNLGVPNHLCVTGSTTDLTLNTPDIVNGIPGLLVDYHTTQLSANDG